MKLSPGARARTLNQSSPFLLLLSFLLGSFPGPGSSTDVSACAFQDPVRLHSDLVVVTATVTDLEDRYARGLRPRDFAIQEDGILQEIVSFSAEETPFAAAILADMSGSMGYKFGLVRAAAATFVEQIRDDDQVAVFGFNNNIHRLQDFSNSRDITDYIWDAVAENDTRLYDCVADAVAALEGREEKRRAIVLISDGWDSSSRKASFESTMKLALASGVTIYTVDLVDSREMRGSSRELLALKRGRRDLKEMAAQTGGRYVHSPNGDRLDDVFTSIVDELRNQYTMTYYSTNERRDGKWRNVSVRVAAPTLNVRARRGYYAPKP